MEEIKNPVGAVLKIAVLQKIAAVAEVKIQVTAKGNLMIPQQIAKLYLRQPVSTIIGGKVSTGIYNIGGKLQAVFFGNIASIISPVAFQVELSLIQIFSGKSSVCLYRRFKHIVAEIYLILISLDRS